jgi:hypothetical protein
MRWCFAVIVVSLVLGGAAFGAILPAVLPMTASVYKDQPSQSFAIRFTGRVPATAGGQSVRLLVRECQSRFSRQIAGTQTAIGGTWEIIVGGGIGFPLASGSTFQARWNGRTTAPFTWRTRIHPFVTKLASSRFRVTISTGYGMPLQNFARRTVLVQRLNEGKYVRLRPLRLTAVDARTFAATFRIPTAGLTLRVLAPTKTTRPCYNAGASNAFHS